ncbi:MAG: plasmid pRiA4b ORF-3 family protein [Planctomycetaceae bacterium]|jgi:hypothetical protein|nr:plasmid pRiA4b ORF-3 family protein [Planctomycetaceae bacterium]
MNNSDKAFLNKVARAMKDSTEPKPTRKGKSGVPPRLLQLKVTLNDTKIWRRFIVPNFFSLCDLHNVLQIVMGWTNSHLSQFIVGKRDDATYYLAQPFEDFDTPFGEFGGEDASKYDLTYLTEKKMKLRYEYDFGDSWYHDIVVENPDVDYSGDVPVVLDGKLNCPPEDCGGVWGYENILELLKDPSKDEDGILEWVGDYNPDEFSIEEINAELADWFKPKPTKKAVKKVTKKTAKKKTVKKKVQKAWVFTGKTESGK